MCNDLSLKLQLLDELCDKLDESGIEGNVIERDSYGRPYVYIWPGSFDDRKRKASEMFTVIFDDGCYEIKPSNKYYDYFIDTFRACVSRKNGFYVMSRDSIVRTIKFLFNREKWKRRTDMKDIAKEGTRDLCCAIARDDNSPLKWSSDTSELGYSIYINNLTDKDKVCRVNAYPYSKTSIQSIIYYVYFTGKYSSAAGEIQDPSFAKLIGRTSSGGYKFISPKHLIDFVKEVVRRIDEKEVKPIEMKWEVRSPAKPLDICAYAEADVLATAALYEYRSHGIIDVIFNDPATIIIWADGSKTVVKAENEPFDPEKGLAMAISKKVLGNKYDYYDIFKKYVGRYEKKQKKGGAE